VSEPTDQDDLYAVSAERLRTGGRPRFVITCDGTDIKRHKPAIVAIYARDDDGTWLPVHSGVRDGGKELIIPETGYRSEAGQFDWPCSNRRCPYRFRADTAQVAQILDRFLAAGAHEVPLRLIDEELRHARQPGNTRNCPGK
jgi:hypothetical protein